MRLLITGAVSWNEEQKKELQSLGHKLVYIQDERIPLKEQGIHTEDIEGTICNGLFLYNDIEDFKNLKYIQLTSAGFDRVPMDYVKENHIEIHNARGVYSVPMAEFALCGVLKLYKQSRFFDENQKKHVWEKQRGLLELSGKNVCIVGCGNVGTECAKRFQAFDCHVTGIDIYPREDKNFAEMLGMEQLDTKLPESDIVVLTLPLTEETRHLMNEKRLQLMKPRAVFVNIARGAVVDTDALVKAMPSLGGAVLDVFEEEPLSKENPLWEMENVILTPHNSFVGEGNRERLGRVILKNIGDK